MFRQKGIVDFSKTFSTFTNISNTFYIINIIITVLLLCCVVFKKVENLFAHKAHF